MDLGLPALGPADGAGGGLPVVALRIRYVGPGRHEQQPAVAGLVRDEHARAVVGDHGVEDLVVLVADGLRGCLPCLAVISVLGCGDVGQLVRQQLRGGADGRLGQDADDGCAAVVGEDGQTEGSVARLVAQVGDELRVVVDAGVELGEGPGHDGCRVVHEG